MKEVKVLLRMKRSFPGENLRTVTIDSEQNRTWEEWGIIDYNLGRMHRKQVINSLFGLLLLKNFLFVWWLFVVIVLVFSVCVCVCVYVCVQLSLLMPECLKTWHQFYISSSIRVHLSFCFFETGSLIESEPNQQATEVTISLILHILE